MDCLVRRKDNTIAYINKMHNYYPKGTPRPTVKKKIYIKMFLLKKKYLKYLNYIYKLYF